MARKKPKYKVTTISPKLKRKKNSLGLAIVGLILNFLTGTGLGSLINGRRSGIFQMILFFLAAIGMYFAYTISGILLLVSWVWGLVTGIKMIQQSK